jgi:hypothetical protein
MEVKTFRKGHPEDVVLPMKKGCYAWLKDTKYNFEKYKGRVEEATKLL